MKLIHAHTLFFPPRSVEFLCTLRLSLFAMKCAGNCRKHLHRPGSQSPPLPPPPPEDDENQHFGRPRTQSVGPLAPIVPDDQNLPGWVPKNYIEKGTMNTQFISFLFISIRFCFTFFIKCIIPIISVVAIYDYYADKGMLMQTVNLTDT